MKVKMIQIIGNEHGDFEAPVTAILNLTSLTGGTQEEPWEEQGTAYSLEDGKPYIGTYGKDTPVYGNPREYIQVWECYYREGNWIGNHATFKGNNHIIELSENPKLSAQFSISTAASLMGRNGGKSRSEAKTAAVRENGRKGGRPKREVKEALDRVKRGEVSDIEIYDGRKTISYFAVQGIVFRRWVGPDGQDFGTRKVGLVKR